jgi:alpha-beta hydrolase superfamily lysophospholipase
MGDTQINKDIGSVSAHALTAKDGMPLRADFYVPAGAESTAERGLLVLIHGYCEHRGRYLHVAEHLLKQGYTVLAGDLRGHGESGGERGFVQRFGDYIDDLDALLSLGQTLDAAFRKTRPGRAGATPPAPPVLVAHSMGGLVGLEYALARPEAFRALVVSAPFLGLRLKVPAWKRGLGLAASLLRPTLRLPNELASTYLSHDPAICQSYDTDPLVTHEATARWFTEALAAQADVRSRASRIRLPVFFMCPGDDKIVDPVACQEVFDRIGSSDKTLNTYPGLYHEIFNELDRERVLVDLSSWLRTR